MNEDVMQMTPFRIELVANISEQSEHLRWCTISLCSDKYYGLQSPEPASRKFSSAAQTMLAKPIREALESKQSEAANDEVFVSPIRKQVFEVIVRQAMAGAPWRELCAGPMKEQRISVAEIEAEVKRRQNNR